MNIIQGSRFLAMTPVSFLHSLLLHPYIMLYNMGLLGEASLSMDAICKLSKYAPSGRVLGMNAISVMVASRRGA